MKRFLFALPLMVLSAFCWAGGSPHTLAMGYITLSTAIDDGVLLSVRHKSRTPDDKFHTSDQITVL